MRKQDAYKRGKLLWGFVLILLWVGAAYLFYRSNGKLSIQELLRFRPKNRMLAAAAMCGLFLLKSMDFLLHSGTLFAISGIMYSLPIAILLNIVGIFIMTVMPYYLGKVFGPSVLKWIYGMFPKFKEFTDSVRGNEFMIAVLLRCSCLPLNMGSLYMGAMRFNLATYLLGSLVGLLPTMLSYTVIGMSAADPTSPIFIASVIVGIGVSAAALWITISLQKKKNEET